MKASDIIRNKMLSNNGVLGVETLNGKVHKFYYEKDGDYIHSYSALRNQQLKLNCFDIVVEHLKMHNGKARKGNGHNKGDKVGYGRCTEDTICGCIAINYYHHDIGDSTFDPVFVVCAVLDAVGVCRNGRGYLELIGDAKQYD